jgi:hypothetical protein
MGAMVIATFVAFLAHATMRHDPSTHALLGSRQLWFVPVVNADGYEYNRKNPSADVRKNRNTKGSRCRQNDQGVDLNRNFDVCWGKDSEDGSADMCSEAYRGPKAMSENEAIAMDALLKGTAVPGIRARGKRRTLGWGSFDEGAPHSGAGVAVSLGTGADGSGFSFALNFHAYGKYINVPYSCKLKGLPPPLQWQVFSEVASSMAKSCGYDWGQSWCQRSKKLGAKGCVNTAGLYPVAGEMSDWMLAEHGVFAMSPEVAPEWPFRGGDGFWPPHKLEHQIMFSLIGSNLLVAWRAGADYTLSVKWHSNPITCVDATVKVTNAGVRTSFGAVVMRLSANQDGGAAPTGVAVGLSSSLCTADLDRVSGFKIHPSIPGRVTVPDVVVHAHLLPTAVPVYYAALYDEHVCTVYSIATTVGATVEGTVVQHVPASMCAGFGVAVGSKKPFGRMEGSVSSLQDFSS